jgi:N-acetylglucosamine-6-phosphate deacetylase
VNFFDLQVNGYAGVDFNGEEELTPAAIEALSARLAEHGVEGILATIITDTLPAMEERLRRVAWLRQQVPAFGKLVRGFHIEGPFISPVEGYRGAHPLDAIRQADLAAMERLLEAAEGLTRVVTLAPEQDPGFHLTGMLAKRGITVSAGHTNASLDELKGAIGAGLTLFTHLGNGCPAVMPRHDNILQRALSLREHLWLCFIADGAHIPFFALKNYLQLTGTEKTVVVTDAIAAASLGPGRYTLGRWNLVIGEDLIARPPHGDHLVGSTVTMERSYRNLIDRVGMSEAEARKLLVENPRKAIGEEA